MADEPDNMTLPWMRRLDEKFDRMIEEVSELKTRVGRLELSVAHVNEYLAEHSVRMGKIDAHLSRIEKRLDLVEAS